MTPGRRWLVLLLTMVAAGMLLTALSYVYAVGPFSAPRVTETRLQPQAVKLLGEGGDPLVLMVGVTWLKDGYCIDQFTVQAVETPTEIRLGDVVSRESASEMCAGVGTREHMAWAELRLAAPLGNRAIIRVSDGTRLPVS